MKKLLPLLFLLWPLTAQADPKDFGYIVTTCGTLPAPYTAGGWGNGPNAGLSGPLSVDINGTLCTAGGSGTASIIITPSSSSSAGIAAGQSASAESGHVAKSGAGNLYEVSGQIGASAGYIMVFNATSAPVDGAVTPYDCWAVPANQPFAKFWSPGPLAYFSTGITFVFSTTGCFTKTASATAFFSWQVQ